MKKINYILFAALIALAGISSCKKDLGTGKRFAYGNLYIKLLNFGDGPDTLTCKFNGEKIGSLHKADGASGPKFVLPAGITGKLSIYTQTDSLLMDTTITIPDNKDVFLKIAFSKSIGINGVVPTISRPLSPDSCYLQLQNNLSLTNYPNTVNLELAYVHYATGVIDPVSIVIKDFKPGQLYPKVVPVAIRDADGELYLAVSFRDAVTGQLIYQAQIGDYFNALETLFFAGQQIVVRCFDYPDGTAYFEMVPL